jgi:hypothetical protein
MRRTRTDLACRIETGLLPASGSHNQTHRGGTCHAPLYARLVCQWIASIAHNIDILCAYTPHIALEFTDSLAGQEGFEPLVPP